MSCLDRAALRLIALAQHNFSRRTYSKVDEPYQFLQSNRAALFPTLETLISTRHHRVLIYF